MEGTSASATNWTQLHHRCFYPSVICQRLTRQKLSRRRWRSSSIYIRVVRKAPLTLGDDGELGGDPGSRTTTAARWKHPWRAPASAAPASLRCTSPPPLSDTPVELLSIAARLGSTGTKHGHCAARPKSPVHHASSSPRMVSVTRQLGGATLRSGPPRFRRRQARERRCPPKSPAHDTSISSGGVPPRSGPPELRRRKSLEWRRPSKITADVLLDAGASAHGLHSHRM